MAKFKVIAVITIEGDSVKKDRDVTCAIQEMLGAFDDMTETTSDTSINIEMLKTEKVEED